MTIPAFPKVWALGTPHTQDLFDGPVEVTEKIDGSQFSFGVVDGNLHVRSKGAAIEVDDPPTLFRPSVNTVLAAHERGVLPEGVVFHGEAISKPKHNVLTYSRVPAGNIVLFGARSLTRGTVFGGTEVADFAWLLGVEPVKMFAYDHIPPAELKDRLEEWLSAESQLGGPKVEGVVIKNYSKMYELFGQPMPFLAGKYVSEAFKEVHGRTWERDHTAKGGLVGLQEQLKAEARWHKAVQALRERGQLAHAPQDIGKLIKYLQQDLQLEEKEWIKDQLWSIFKDDLIRAATRGFPEWYKNQLVTDTFTVGSATTTPDPEKSSASSETTPSTGTSST